MIKKYDIDPKKWKSERLLFPKFIANDEWVLYHGTSSSNEKLIEKKGITAEASLFSREEVLSILELFIRIGSFGKTDGGFATLVTFGEWDLRYGYPIFLGESALRCLTYAHSNFAGGEKSRSIRNCGRDLLKIFEDSKIYQDYKDNVEKHKHQLAFYGQEKLTMNLLNEIRIYTQDEIKEEYKKLSALWEKAEKVYTSHNYGIIYAIKYNVELASSLIIHDAQGVLSLSSIPTSQIIGKIIVNDEMSKASKRDGETYLEWMKTDIYKSMKKWSDEK